MFITGKVLFLMSVPHHLNNEGSTQVGLSPVFPVLLLYMLKSCEKRLKWSEQDKPSFDPSALRLQWGDATVSTRLCELELEETASSLQGTLYSTLLYRREDLLSFKLSACTLYRTCDLVPESLSNTEMLHVFYGTV